MLVQSRSILHTSIEREREREREREMEPLPSCSSAVAGCCFLLLLLVVWKVFRAVLWEPWTIKRALEKQGVKCLPYTPLFGNLPDISRMLQAGRAAPLPLLPHRIVARVAPYYDFWKRTYGDAFVFWLGYKAVMPVSDPQLVKEVLFDKCGHFRKLLKPAIDLAGEAVGSLEGERWAQHRCIVSPAFFVDKLKVMAPTMVGCISEILDKWDSQLSEGHGTNKEIDVHEEFKVLTADIIAHTAFGSSYEEGRQVFKLQREQLTMLVRRLRFTHIPGYRYLPTPGNRHARRLKAEIHTNIERIINSRGEDRSRDDLLGILLASDKGELAGTRTKQLSMQEIVDECKTFFFAGYETMATLMTWTTMLLAINPEWQERAREEVLQVLGSEELPTYSLLHNLKTVGMVLNEALRLYPPATFLLRETTRKIRLGSLSIPANVVLMVAIVDLHCDPALWGKDALDFNPERFVDGVGRACKAPLAFCPFSIGPRHCLGQNFAMAEARAILAMMLRRFRFSLSPGYSHCPTSVLTLRPQHGMPIIFERL